MRLLSTTPSTRPRSPRPRDARRLRRMWPVVAAVAALAIVGSLTTAPDTAQAADAHAAAAEAAMAASIRSGTFEDDVVSGRITVDQLVDVDISARTAPGAAPVGPVPSRAALTLATITEVQQLRATAIPAAPTSEPGAAGPLASQASVFTKIKRWFHASHTAKIPTLALGISAGSSVSPAALVSAACFYGGAVWCGFFAASAGLLLAGLAVLAAHCWVNGYAYVYLKFPDTVNSYCGN